MSRCPVCAETVADGAEKCQECETPSAILAEIVEATRKRGLLFDTFVMPEPSPSREPLPAEQVPSSRETLPLPVQGGTLPLEPDAPKVRKPVVFSQPDPFDPVVTARDTGLESVPMRRARPTVHPSGLVLVAMVWDSLLCGLMNLSVFSTIWMVSTRSFSDLIAYSLLPLLFVFLTLTVIYFVAFKGLLGRTPGRLLAERLGYL